MADTTTTDPVLQVLDRFTDASNAHDIEAMVALCSDDIVFESTEPAPDGVRHEGLDAVRRVWGQLLESTPEARFSVGYHGPLRPRNRPVLRSTTASDPYPRITMWPM